MSFSPFPPQAAWRHSGAREGFEVAFLTPLGGAVVVRGGSAGVQDGVPWSLGYDLVLGVDGRTTTARVRLQGRDGEGELLLERDDDDRWSLDGVHRPDLDGLRDVDLAGSLLTNAFPLRRLDPGPDPVTAPAVLVGLDLAVARIEQTYARVGGEGSVAYTSLTFDFSTVLSVDAAGLVVDYPPLGARHL